uniref:Transmembrane protein 176l.3a n=1 Tax=Cyprinus carpio TaxID=7962 RepID=A0A8C1WYT0_CYPCA
MTLTVSQGEGLTVITVASNPKSRWPVLCQILGFLCYSPVCSVSQDIKKGQLKVVHTSFGIVQMLIGVFNIAVGIVFTCVGLYYNMYRIAQGPFWLGSVFLVAGIVCILAARFPNFCLVIIGMVLHIVSAALAITAVVLYSVDLANDHTEYCETYNSYYPSYYNGYDYGYGYGYRTPSPEMSRRNDICLHYRNLIEMIFRGLDIMMIVLSVLQLCVTISFCVLTGKALCKKDEDAKSVEDPELHKPLLEDDTAGAA